MNNVMQILKLRWYAQIPWKIQANKLNQKYIDNLNSAMSIY